MTWPYILALVVWCYGSGIFTAWLFRDLHDEDPLWTDYPAAVILSQAIPIVLLVIIVLLSPLLLCAALVRLAKWVRS
jgi:hypothetical protein